jgi:Flp pilus assembly protein TadD
MTDQKQSLIQDTPEAMFEAYMRGAFRDELGLESGDLDLMLDLARQKMVAGKLGEAIAIYSHIVFIEPGNSNYLLGLANCAIEAGSHNLALYAASLLVAIDPENPRAYYFSGVACKALGHLAEAEEDFRDALRLAEESSDALVIARSKVFLAGLKRN